MVEPSILREKLYNEDIRRHLVIVLYWNPFSPMNCLDNQTPKYRFVRGQKGFHVSSLTTAGQHLQDLVPNSYLLEPTQSGELP